MGDNSVPGIVGKIKRKQIAKIWKPPECLLVGERLKMLCVYTMEYYSAIKKKEFLPSVTTWVDIGVIMLSEIVQTEKDKYCVITFTYGI